jgi:hypothetical protein
MTKERAITKLELIPTQVGKDRGWVTARWQRADGSRGEVTAHFRLLKAERWYIARLLIDLPTSPKLRDVPLARIETAVNADAKIQEWIETGAKPAIIDLRRRAAAKRPRLSRPRSRRLDDDFYGLVADAYRGAVVNGLPPSKTLAEDSETPPGTVNRWIAEARRRGHLPPAEPGKVSA